MGPEPRDPWKTSESEPASTLAEAPDMGVAAVLSDRNVRMRALLNRALGCLSDGQATRLVLEAVRLLDDPAVEHGAAERA